MTTRRPTGDLRHAGCRKIGQHRPRVPSTGVRVLLEAPGLRRFAVRLPRGHAGRDPRDQGPRRLTSQAQSAAPNRDAFSPGLGISVRTARGATAREFGRDSLAARAGRIETRRDPNGNDGAGESLWATRTAQFLVVKTEKANPSYVSNLLIMSTRFDTHDVTNQPPPLSGHDVFGTDVALRRRSSATVTRWAIDELLALGGWRVIPSAQDRVASRTRTHPSSGRTTATAHRARRRRVPPRLPRADGGRRSATGLHGAPWGDPRAGAHVARAAKVITWYQVDGGHMCPISMTYSVVPALRHQPDLAAEWEPRIASRSYDGSNVPPRSEAGDHVRHGDDREAGWIRRAGQHHARVEPTDDGSVALTGHKWFCSAPMSDAFLMLAQAPRGPLVLLGAAVASRRRPQHGPHPATEGQARRSFERVERDRDARDAWGRVVGEEGRGVRTIIEMVNHTRLDCVLGSTAVIRQGVAQSTWHTHHRRAFGADLDRQPLMANVLADLIARVGGATAAALRIARPRSTHPARRVRATPATNPDRRRQVLDVQAGAPARRRVPRMPGRRGLRRGVGPSPPVPAEPAQRRVGGLGERDLPRRAPGDGPVARVGGRLLVRSSSPSRAATDGWTTSVGDVAQATRRPRRPRSASPVGRRADGPGVRRSLLVRHAPPAVADAFCASRLGDHSDRAFGTMPAGIDVRSIVARSRPT